MDVITVGENAESFPCRSLFKPGTGLGTADTEFRSDVSAGLPVFMKGTMRSYREMQESLSPLGLATMHGRYRGKIGGNYIFKADVDLPDGIYHMEIERTYQGMNIRGLPGGLPPEIFVIMNPGESALAAHITQSGKLVLLTMEMQ